MEVAWAASGRRLVSRTAEPRILGETRIWSLDAPGEGVDLGESLGAAFLPGGDQLALLQRGGAVRIWDGSLGTVVRELAPGTDGEVFAVSPPGTRIATAAADGEVTVWSLDTDTTTAFATRTVGIINMAFAPDGHQLVTITIEGEMQVWNADSGRLVQGSGQAPGWLASLAHTPAGARVATGTWNGPVIVTNTRPTSSDDFAALAIQRSNLRVCRSTLSVVAVMPYPTDGGAWAPEDLCGIGGQDLLYQ